MLHFKNLTKHPDEHIAGALGFIPSFLSEHDDRPAREQLDMNYAHGGGWSPMAMWTFNEADKSIHYPGDPPLRPIAQANLRSEMILVYQHAWVAIVQPDGSYEVARMD